MKIYFEDDSLKNCTQLPEPINFVIDAKYGVSSNFNLLDNLKEQNKNFVIYTNSIVAFSNQYAWNPTLGVPEIYIRTGEHMLFTRIDELTERELKEGHNLAKMYVAGEFDSLAAEKIINKDNDFVR